MPLWITWIVDAVLALWKGRGPTPIVSEAEKVGAAEQALATEKANEADVQRASAAGDNLSPVLTDPGKLRDYEASDPNNRDRT